MSEINWYLTKTNHAIDKISKLRAPINGNELRFQYSSLIESIFSTLDCLLDKNQAFNNADHINAKIEEKLGDEGEDILVYLRETRNAVVHRGLDITKRGDSTKEGKVVLHVPHGITSRSGKMKKKPSETRLDILLHNLDKAIKEIAFDELTLLGLLTTDDDEKIEEIANKIKNISLPDDVPEYAKSMFMEYQNSLTTDSANKVASQMYNSKIKDLKENLSITMDIRHLSEL